MKAATLGTLSSLLYGGALVTLPWVGFGTIHLLTGVDTGAGFQPAYLLLAAACLLAGLAPGTTRGRAPWRWGRPWSGLLAASVMVVLLSSLGLLLRPADVPGSLRWLRFGKQLLQYLVLLAFVVYPWAWTRGNRRWHVTCVLLAVGMVSQLVYGTLQVVNYWHPVGWFVTLDALFTSNPAILAGSEELFLGEGFRQIPRVRGTMCEPLYLGNYLLLVIPCLLLPWSRRRGAWLLPLGGAGLLVLTWARGAYLAAIVSVAVALILLRRSGAELPLRRWLGRLLLSVVLAAVLVAVLWGPAAVLLPLQRLAQSLSRQDWSNLTRFYSMQAGWRAFLSSPVFGIGWGQFAFHFFHLVDSLGLQSQFAWPVVNNFPLEILCETGLLGFGLFGLTAGLLARAVWRSLEPTANFQAGSAPAARLRLIAAASAVTGIWCQLLTFSQYNLPHIWVGLGLLLAALREIEHPGGVTDTSAQRRPPLPEGDNA
jgi:O-antigen ligase